MLVMTDVPMKLSRSGTAFTLVTLAILVLGGVLARRIWTGLRSMDSLSSCSESSESQIAGPNKKYTAEVFVRNCGATTGYVTHINLRDAGEAFVADQNGVISTGEVVSLEGNPRVHVTWVQESLLDVQVSSDRSLRDVNRSEAWRSVRIQVHN